MKLCCTDLKLLQEFMISIKNGALLLQDGMDYFGQANNIGSILTHS